MVRKKIKEIRKKPSKIKKVKRKVKKENLEEEIENSERQQFSQFVSTGKKVSPTLETGQEVVRRTAQQSGAQTARGEVEGPNVEYGPRRSQTEEKKYEAVILKSENFEEIGDTNIRQSRTSTFSEKGALGRDKVTEDIRLRENEKRNYKAPGEKEGMRVKRSSRWHM